MVVKVGQLVMLGNMLIGCVKAANKIDEVWEILVTVPTTKGIPAAKSVSFIDGVTLRLKTSGKPQLITPSKVLVDPCGKPLMPARRRPCQEEEAPGKVQAGP